MTIAKCYFSLRYDGCGGKKSLGRELLLKLLQTPGLTETAISKRIKCTDEFVSLVVSGKRKPERWRLRVALEREYGIPAASWDELPPEKHQWQIRNLASKN